MYVCTYALVNVYMYMLYVRMYVMSALQRGIGGRGSPQFYMCYNHSTCMHYDPSTSEDWEPKAPQGIR